jgi:hypothetical protein
MYGDEGGRVGGQCARGRVVVDRIRRRPRGRCTRGHIVMEGSDNGRRRRLERRSEMAVPPRRVRRDGESAGQALGHGADRRQRRQRGRSGTGDTGGEGQGAAGVVVWRRPRPNLALMLVSLGNTGGGTRRGGRGGGTGTDVRRGG